MPSFTGIASATHKFTSDSAHPLVTQRSQYPLIHRHFLKFATKLGLLNSTEVTFFNFPEEIILALRGGIELIELD